MNLFKQDGMFLHCWQCNEEPVQLLKEFPELNNLQLYTIDECTECKDCLSKKGCSNLNGSTITIDQTRRSHFLNIPYFPTFQEKPTVCGRLISKRFINNHLLSDRMRSFDMNRADQWISLRSRWIKRTFLEKPVS